MNKLWIGIALVLAMAGSASAYLPECDETFASGGGGWAHCNTAGSYGGEAQNCCVAWDPDTICQESTRDASFVVGANGMYTTSITIEHLDGIAETYDGFEIKDGSTVLCRFNDAASGPETWKTMVCDGYEPGGSPYDDYFSSFSGVKTLTIHPTAAQPWSLCGDWGQVAVKGISFVTTQVPEFGTVAAVVALAGAMAGFLVIRRK
jgi:hypothetical protein